MIINQLKRVEKDFKDIFCQEAKELQNGPLFRKGKTLFFFQTQTAFSKVKLQHQVETIMVNFQPSYLAVVFF